MAESLILFEEINAEDECLKNQLKTVLSAKSGLFKVASQASEKIFKSCIDFATSSDPLSTAINICGVNGLGLALSRLSAGQCCGFIGLIVSSFHPQLAVPLILKKITDNLDEIKEGMNIIRQRDYQIAQQELKYAMEELENNQFEKIIHHLQEAKKHAEAGTKMSPTFDKTLNCLQIEIFAKVLLLSSANIKGVKCFVPMHFLSQEKKEKVKAVISEGLSKMLTRAESTKWNGKRSISKRKQNLIDPYLGALFNMYSFASGLTNPYVDCSLPPPNKIRFTIDVEYIPEGESDNCSLEILLHASVPDIILFIWKEFEKDNTIINVRLGKTTWIFNASNGNLYELIYDTDQNRMSTSAGELERIIGWPHLRMNVEDLIEEAIKKKDGIINQLSRATYKWIQKVPLLYLQSMEIDLDHQNKQGMGLVHSLAKLDDLDSISCILDKILNIDAVDSLGRTALHYCCIHRSFRVAKNLVKKGANVNKLTDDMESPLTILATHKKQDKSLLKLLLRMNADRGFQNKEKMRAVDIFRRVSQDEDIIKLLKPI